MRAPDDSPFHSPKAVFSSLGIEASRLAAAFCLSQTEPPARNGLSLARNGCLFQGLHSGVKVPGLLLRLLASRFRNPFGSSAPLPPASSYSPRPLPCLVPVAASTTGSPNGSPSFHSPSGLLPPEGSKCSTGPGTRRPAFRFRPISVRSPQPQTSELDLLATDHRSRSATFPEACCSSNLLEPDPLCARRRFRSIFICPLTPCFLKFYSLCFYMVTGPWSCKVCE